MNTLTRWRSPRLTWPAWPSLESIDRRLGRLFEPPFATEETFGFSPPANLVEQDGEYLLTVELPGMKKEDVSVSVEEDYVVVKGEKQAEKEEKGSRWHVVERSWGSFERSFPLPRTVQSDKVKAEFEDGILSVHLPKRTEARGRRVEISGK
jgi:HSP20 family protein